MVAPPEQTTPPSLGLPNRHRSLGLRRAAWRTTRRPGPDAAPSTSGARAPPRASCAHQHGRRHVRPPRPDLDLPHGTPRRQREIDFPQVPSAPWKTCSAPQSSQLPAATPSAPNRYGLRAPHLYGKASTSSGLCLGRCRRQGSYLSWKELQMSRPMFCILALFPLYSSTNKLKEAVQLLVNKSTNYV
jgi:hypothetical protein